MVDAMNVIGSRPDGWWRDRAAAAHRLVENLRALARATGDEVTVVFEGGELTGVVPGRDAGVEVLFARRRGLNAADDRIVELVGADPGPTSLTIVTSDRDLARRVRELGASVVGPGSLLTRLDAARR